MTPEKENAQLRAIYQVLMTVAHSILAIIYHLLYECTSYQEMEKNFLEEQDEVYNSSLVFFRRVSQLYNTGASSL
jgi:hypothetical protein